MQKNAGQSLRKPYQNEKTSAAGKLSREKDRKTEVKVPE